MVRPNEASNASWSEFDFDKKEWTIPAERMKVRFPHTVPLSHQFIRKPWNFKFQGFFVAL